MAVRTSMTALITELRRLTAASITEFPDQYLQDTLDRNKMEYRDVGLQPTRTSTSDNSAIYLIYDLPEYLGEWFETPADNVINTFFYLTNSTHYPIVFGSGDEQAVFDPNLRRITFNADTNGTLHYLTVIAYDMNGAAAEIWNIKCGNRASLVDIKTDNHTLALSQEREFICADRIKYFSSRSWKARDARFSRVDQGLNYQHRFRGFDTVFIKPDDWN